MVSPRLVTSISEAVYFPPGVIAHFKLNFAQDDLKDALQVTFVGTLRLPDNVDMLDPPYSRGPFPIFNTQRYQESLPQSIFAEHGLFIPTDKYEAVFLSFEPNRPIAVRVQTGHMEHHAPFLATQNWLEGCTIVHPADRNRIYIKGITKNDGSVIQFAASNAGSECASEVKDTGLGPIDRLQIIITPLKAGTPLKLNVLWLAGGSFTINTHSMASVYEVMTEIRGVTGYPTEKQRLMFEKTRLAPHCLLSSYGIPDEGDGAQLHLFSYSRAINTYFAKKIDDSDPKPKAQQSPASHPNMQWILRQIHPPEEWDTSSTIGVAVHLLNLSLCQRITGMGPPPNPLTPEVYRRLGLPVYNPPLEPGSERPQTLCRRG